MEMADRLTALLEGAAQTVGRVYLEELSGSRVMVTYGKASRQREPMVRFRGAVYYQSFQLADGTWVYRTTDVVRSGSSDPWLSEVSGPGDDGWVHPSDWPPAPDHEADAYGAVCAAIGALKAFPGHAELVARLEAAILAPAEDPVPPDVPEYLQPR